MSSTNESTAPSILVTRWRKPSSLALRLTAFYVGSSFVILLAATIALYLILESSLAHAQDQFLTEKVAVLRAMMRERPDQTWQLNEEIEETYAPRQYSRVFARVLDEAGKVVIESPQMSPSIPQSVFPAPTPFGQEPRFGVMVTNASGLPLRAMSAVAQLGNDPLQRRTIQVALDTQLTRELLAGYRRTLLFVLGVGLLGCGVTGYFIGRAGLQPLRDIANTIQRIRSSNLDERIETTRLPPELLTLAMSFNTMLERLQESFDRLKRFSADIAHELRTPVNNMRIEAEVALGKARTLNEYQETLCSCLEECGRLSRIIDGMLFIARAENPRTQVQRELIDVGAELERVREYYEAPAAEAGVDLTVSCDDGTRAMLDRILFQRAVGNLLANAIRYTPRSGSVRMIARRDNGELEVDVVDTGTGIDPSDLALIFDRFYRADRARATSSGNAGLGLAIVKSIVLMHGGTISVESKLQRGTTMRLRIPAMPNDALHYDVPTRDHRSSSAS
jgi:two-component system, OmpR family, heavy metal sensor histidine kinase CusS